MTPKLTLLLLLIILAQGICFGQSTIKSDTTTFDYLIGTNLDSLSKSKDFYQRFYGVIGDINTEKIPNNYAVLVFEVKGKHLVLFVESNSENKTLSYLIKDQILIDKLGKEYSIGIQQCSKKDRWDSSIFAVLKNKNQEELDDVVEAWKFDYLKGRILSKKNDGVTCSRMFSVN